MNIETSGKPRITVAYEGAEASGGESGCAIALEVVCILLFLLLIWGVR